MRIATVVVDHYHMVILVYVYGDIHVVCRHGDIVYCHGDIVYCHGDIIYCHGDIVYCHSDTVDRCDRLPW